MKNIVRPTIIAKIFDQQHGFMITTIYQRLSFTLLMIAALATLITTQPMRAQSFPWSVQTQQIIPNGGAVSFTKINAPKGDTMNVMALGIAGAVNVVCRTTNSGASWDTPLQRYFQEPKMNDLSHPTPSVAVIVGDTMYRDTGTTVFYTHDGGDTWQQGWCDSCRYAGGQRAFLEAVSMCDSLNGIMSAAAFILARTTDGGITWRRIPIPTSGQEIIYDIQCFNASTYILSVSDLQSHISSTYQTFDSGKTWTHHAKPQGSGTPDFVTSSLGWSAGNRPTDSTIYNTIFRTIDAGASWDTLFESPIPSQHYDRGAFLISMADATHGIASGNAGTWLYTNNGTTWQYGPNLDSIFHVFNITSVTYPHPNKGWATDVLGRILVYEPRTSAVPIEPTGTTAAVHLDAFPNPITSGALSIAITLPQPMRENAPAHLSLVDVRGTTVATLGEIITYQAGTVHLSWTIPPLPVGTYFLRLVDGETVAALPITIVR